MYLLTIKDKRGEVVYDGAFKTLKEVNEKIFNIEQDFSCVYVSKRYGETDI